MSNVDVPDAVASKSANQQATIAGMIVVGLTLVALVAVCGGVYEAYRGHNAEAAWTTAGMAVGALATALNAPTGVASVIASAKKAITTD